MHEKKKMLIIAEVCTVAKIKCNNNNKNNNT